MALESELNQWMPAMVLACELIIPAQYPVWCRDLVHFDTPPLKGNLLSSLGNSAVTYCASA